jgi:hypothetical protein
MKTYWVGRIAQVLQGCIASMSSNSSTAKTKKEERKKRKKDQLYNQKASKYK